MYRLVLKLDMCVLPSNYETIAFCPAGLYCGQKAKGQRTLKSKVWVVGWGKAYPRSVPYKNADTNRLLSLEPKTS